jgi:hypothetical protein
MFSPELVLEIAQIRKDIACSLRTIAVRSGSRKFEVYVETLISRPNYSANVFKASPLLGSSLDQIDLEMFEELYNVYCDFCQYDF